YDPTVGNDALLLHTSSVYLGAYDTEDDAARTYDLAALKHWGRDASLNFPVGRYVKELEEMKKMSNEEYLAFLRRRSSGFSRGVSKYRGVARHHHNGRWEARIGRIHGNKYLYLGTYSTQEEAAEAYDRAALEFRGPNAITNFDINRYTQTANTFAPNEERQEVDAPETESMPPGNVLPVCQEFENPDAAILESSVPEDSAIVVAMEDLINPEAMNDTIDSIDTQPIVAVDPTNVQATTGPVEAQVAAPWDDICLDVGFNNFTIPDISMGNGSGGVFDYKGFDDNIDFMFDGSMNDTEMFFNGDGEANAVAPVAAADASSSPSLSSPASASTSTAASTGSNM
ncbi:ethylene-responsive transcription factor WRI1-like, partial [Andrographis paniculata]|uniref:ethylene-responsive transcription factor WRI1-like n=1 Tax=Andrographis paniculata TaxID=175694 RepID=UPI0021E926DE